MVVGGGGGTGGGGVGEVWMVIRWKLLELHPSMDRAIKQAAGPENSHIYKPPTAVGKTPSPFTGSDDNGRKLVSS